MPSPLLCLDVDGVLAPICDNPPAGFARYRSGAAHLWLHPQHGLWLRTLAESFEVVWASLWEEQANTFAAQAWGLGPLPHMGFDPLEVAAPPGVTGKLSTVTAYAGERPLVWIDDDLSGDAHGWATDRHAPTLLLPVDPARGWNLAIVNAAVAFANAQR